MITKTPISPPVSTWGGSYAGASFGLTSQRANGEGVEPQTSTFTSVSPGFSDMGSSSANYISSVGGRGLGATANLYLGYNYMLPNNFLLGGQIEGGVSNTHTTMNGMFSGPTQSVSTQNSSFGGISTTTSTSSSSGNSVMDLDNRWVMSALVRGGLLVDPKDLIYLVGGVSYGRFELLDESFGAFGGTIGAGWERKITPSWTLKAEYRYTRYQDRTVTDSLNSSSSSSAGTNSSFSASTAVETGKVSGSIGRQCRSGCRTISTLTVQVCAHCPAVAARQERKAFPFLAHFSKFLAGIHTVLPRPK